jgi:dTDP-4-amino-4,6-dideoxygalactose transaminase
LYIESNSGLSRDQVIQYLASNNIQARPIWGLINEQKPYLNSQAYKIEKAKHYWERVVNIPCSSNLLREDAQYVVDCLSHIKK